MRRGIGPPWLLTLTAIVGFSVFVGLVSISRFGPWALATGLVALILLGLRLSHYPPLLISLTSASGFMFYLPGLGSQHLSVSDFFLPGAAVAALVASWNSDPRDRHDGHSRPMFAAATILCAVSTSTLYASTEIGFRPDLAVIDAAKITVGVSYFAVIYVGVKRLGWRRIRFLLQSWAVVASLQGAGSILTGLGLPIMPTDGVRVLGFFHDPNLFAGYLLVSVGVVVAVDALKNSPWVYLQLFALMGGVLGTGSRGALITLSVVLLVGVFRKARTGLRRFFMAVLAATVPTAVWFSSAKQGPVGFTGVDRLTASSGSSGGDPRFELWRAALEAWSAHPLFGVGMGQFTRYTTGIGGYAKGDLGYVAHNTFISVGVEVGILGLIITISLFVWLWRTVQSSSLTPQIKSGLLLGLVALISQMMTLNLQNLRYVWLFLGVTAGLASVGSGGGQPPVRHPKAATRHEL